jgi:apolipoprotein N-acyltransferase
MSRTEERRALLAALVAGIALAIAFPLFDQGWLAFVALTPLLRAARTTTTMAAAFRQGWLTGAVFFSILLYWILGVMTTYGGLPRLLGVMVLLLLVAYLASYIGLFAALVSAATRRWGPAAILLAPVFWVGLELARGRLLTGFPWGLIGYSQWRNLAIVQASAWGGIYAVSFLVVLANAACALLLERPARRGAVAMAISALLLVAAAHAGGRLALRAVSAADGPPIAVAAIQANVPQDRKWRPDEEEGIVAGLLSMSAQAADDGARLVVWPESSSPIGFRRPVPAPQGGTAPVIEPRREYLRRIGDVIGPRDVTLIAGSVDYGTRAGRLRAFNSAFVVGSGGTLDASYDKMHLVPFGEYVPLQRLLFFVDTMVQGAIAGFAPGDRLDPLPTPLGPVATFVCYEAIFPELVRALARPSVFMVNITNDAWFGKSAAPTQHLAMAVFRAAENRRWLLRAANTGISAVVDPAGRVRASSDLMTRTVLLGRLAPRRDRTLYAATGDLLAWACATLTVLSGAALCAAFKRPGIERAGAEASETDGSTPRHR